MIWGINRRGYLGAVLFWSHDSLVRWEMLTEASAGEGDGKLGCRVRVGANKGKNESQYWCLERTILWLYGFNDCWYLAQWQVVSSTGTKVHSVLRGDLGAILQLKSHDRIICYGSFYAGGGILSRSLLSMSVDDNSIICLRNFNSPHATFSLQRRKPWTFPLSSPE